MVYLMDKLNEWIKAERGRLKTLGEELKMVPHAIGQWTRVPAERMGSVSFITGIPMEDLRPDIFAQARGESGE